MTVRMVVTEYKDYWNKVKQTNLSGSAKRRLYFKVMLRETIGINDF